VIRLHQFLEATASKTFQVGLETRRPVEQPLSAPEYSRPVSISVPIPAPTSLLTAISGTDLMSPSAPESATWTQQASQGVPAYQYGSWAYYRYPGPEVPGVGFGSSYERTVDPTTTPYVFRLKAEASDALPQPALGKWFVEVVPGGGGGGAAATVEPRTPGVRLADGSCGSRPPSGFRRQQWLEWVFNNRQGRVETCARS
jgi:hypothetical protein